MSRIRDHMDADRKPFGTLHRLIARLVELILDIIVEMLLIRRYSGYWHDSCRIIENAPDHGKGWTVAELLTIPSLTFAWPSLKAGIKNPGQIIRSISLLLRY